MLVRFLVECGLLFAVATVVNAIVAWEWGFAVAFLAAAAVAALWGLFLSPKAPVKLPAAAALVLEAALFVGAGVGLALIGHPGVALIGVVAWGADRVVLALTDR